MKTLKAIYSLSIVETKRRLRRYHVTLLKFGDDWAVSRRKYPGKFRCCANLKEALHAVKEMAMCHFQEEMNDLWVGRERATLQEESKDALLQWFDLHGESWQYELERAWSNGRYDAPNLTSSLQRLRNSEHGHELVYKLGKTTPNLQR